MPLHVLVTCGRNGATAKHEQLANWLIEQMTAVLKFKPVGSNAPLDMVRGDLHALWVHPDGTVLCFYGVL